LPDGLSFSIVIHCTLTFRARLGRPGERSNGEEIRSSPTWDRTTAVSPAISFNNLFWESDCAS